MNSASAVRIATLRQAQYVANLCFVFGRLWHLLMNAQQNLLRNCTILFGSRRTDNNALHRSFSLSSGRETAFEAISTDYQECTNELSINQILHLDKRIGATVSNLLARHSKKPNRVCDPAFFNLDLAVISRGCPSGSRACRHDWQGRPDRPSPYAPRARQHGYNRYRGGAGYRTWSTSCRASRP